MRMPPDYLLGLLQTIEQATINVHEEFPKLEDNDVEWVYDQLLKFYKKRISDKNTEEPLSSIERRQILIDEILNIIDEREEMEADISIINNPNCINGGSLIPSLEILYSLAFKILRNSTRFWRKKDGKKGYLNYISAII